MEHAVWVMKTPPGSPCIMPENQLCSSRRPAVHAPTFKRRQAVPRQKTREVTNFLADFIKDPLTLSAVHPVHPHTHQT